MGYEYCDSGGVYLSGPMQNCRLRQDIKALSEALEVLEERPGDLVLDAKLHGCIAHAAYNVFCSHILAERVRLQYDKYPEGFRPRSRDP